MSDTYTQIEKISIWIEKITFDDLPVNVIKFAKLQMLDCVAAISAGYRSEVGRIIYQGIKKKKSSGNFPIIPTGVELDFEDSVYFHSSMINALEMDNFSYMGHLSQSAFSASWSLTQKVKKSGKDLLLASIVAQEISGRLGAYLSSGPLQGHMRSFIHRITGAIVVTKLYDCSKEIISNAISIALSGPEFYMIPSSFSADTKISSTSGATIEGMKAGFLAMEGFSGALDIVEHPAGFVSTFSYLKDVPDFWKTIGKTWVMESISFKKYAGCAYSQASISAAAELINKNRNIQISEIKEVTINCPLLTVVMEKFSIPHYNSGLTQVNINFSTKRSVAATLLFGPPDGFFFSSADLKNKYNQIEELSKKIKLKHNWKMSIDMIRGFDKCIVNEGYSGVFGMNDSQKALKKTRRAYGNRSLFELKDISQFLKLSKKDFIYISSRYLNSIKGKYLYRQRKSYESDLSKLEFALSSEISIRLKKGIIIKEKVNLPKGFSGDQKKEETVKVKFYRETKSVYGSKKAQNILDMITNLETIDLKELFDEIYLNNLKEP